MRKDKEGIIHLVLVVIAGVFIILTGLIFFILKSDTDLPGSSYIKEKAKMYTPEVTPSPVISDSDEANVIEQELEETHVAADEMDVELQSLEDEASAI